MNEQELIEQLTYWNEQLYRIFPSCRDSYEWFWSVFEDVFEDYSSIPFNLIKLFDNYCPNFSARIRCYGITKKTDIKNAYAEKRQKFYSKIRNYEDGHPEILYLYTPNVINPQTGSEYVPFGAFEKPYDDQYFINALISPRRVFYTSDDYEREAYLRFNAYIFSRFVHDIESSDEQLRHCITSDSVQFLSDNYPRFMERFIQNQSAYLDSINYTSIRNKFDALKKAEEKELDELPAEEADTLVSILINDRYIPITYE